MRTNNPAWAEIEKRAVDQQVRKSGREPTRVERAIAISKFLSTPEGQALYEAGGGARGYGYDPRRPANDDDEVVTTKREPIAKADDVWERIKTAAETIQKSDLRGRVSFSKAVDRVLNEHPDWYAEYRRALMEAQRDGGR